jgi:hypothetical protein
MPKTLRELCEELDVSSLEVEDIDSLKREDDGEFELLESGILDAKDEGASLQLTKRSDSNIVVNVVFILINMGTLWARKG